MPEELRCPSRWWHIQVMARHEWCHCVWPQVMGLVLHSHSPDPSLCPQPSAGFGSQGRCPGELHTKPPDFKCPKHHDGNVTFRAELLLWVLPASPKQSVISWWTQWPTGCCTGGSASCVQVKQWTGAEYRGRTGMQEPSRDRPHPAAGAQGDPGDPGGQDRPRGAVWRGPHEHRTGWTHKHPA